MTITEAIRYGLGRTRRAAWMVVLFFACNLLLAAAIAAPVYTAISDHLGNSAFGWELARGFDASWLAEFQIAQAHFLRSFSIAVVYAGILFLALNTVLSAGAFEVYRQGSGAGMRIFGHGIGTYFGRFARIAAVASLLYLVVFWFWQGPAQFLTHRLTEQGVHESSHFYLEWIRWGLLLASVVVINAWVEYAKADIVTDEHGSALAAMGHAAGFLVTHFWPVIAIDLALGLMTALTVVVYSAFARFFPQSSVFTVLVWFVVAQALLWLRWLFRLSSWGAAVAYYGAHATSEAPIAVEAEART